MIETASRTDFAADGAELFARVLDEDALLRVEAAVAGDPDRPGMRLFSLEAIRVLTATDGQIGSIVHRLHGSGTRPVRAIMFDKRSNMNWSIGLHQDRTIAVAERRDVPGYGPWSIKAGQVHVRPPPDLIARMVTLRIHLDDVDADNAPLLILRGTHNRGQLFQSTIDRLSNELGPFACHAKRGDIWAYGTAIVHGSAAVSQPGRRRRVLQIDYSRDALPGGLVWTFDANPMRGIGRI